MPSVEAYAGLHFCPELSIKYKDKDEISCQTLSLAKFRLKYRYLTSTTLIAAQVAAIDPDLFTVKA
jgi:hypothetical protein